MGKLKHTLILLGGFTGFSVAFAASMAAGNSIDQMVFNGAIGCLVGAVLLKWIADLLSDSFIVARRKALKAAQSPPSQAPANAMPRGMTSAASKILKNATK